MTDRIEVRVLTNALGDNTALIKTSAPIPTEKRQRIENLIDIELNSKEVAHTGVTSGDKLYVYKVDYDGVAWLGVEVDKIAHFLKKYVSIQEINNK